MDQQRGFKWMDALAREGFLVCFSRGDWKSGVSSQSRLVLPPGVVPVAVDGARVVAGALDDPALDVWHGPSGAAQYRTWCMLRDDVPMSAAELSACTGATEQAVRKNLALLVDRGLAAKVRRYRGPIGLGHANRFETRVALERCDRVSGEPVSRFPVQWYVDEATGEKMPVRAHQPPGKGWLQLRPEGYDFTMKEKAADRAFRHQRQRDVYLEKLNNWKRPLPSYIYDGDRGGCSDGGQSRSNRVG